MRLGHPRRAGQVLILAIVGMTMLVALIFYVYNLGDQVSRRLSLQNIADSVAVSGAGKMVRCMNLVAMNNVAASRAVALVPVMDGIRLSSQMAYEELKAWREGMERTMDQMKGEAALNNTVKQKVLEGMRSLHERLQKQEDTISPVLAMRPLIEKAATWAQRGRGGAPPHGDLWRTAATVDEISQATVDAAGVLAQANAVRFAHDNLGADVKDSAAFIVPVLPKLPAHRGQLADFSPVLRQCLRVDLEAANIGVENGSGGAIPNAKWPYRLGPWARLLHYPDRYWVDDERFRDWFNQQEPGYWQYHGQKKRGWRRPWGIRVPVGPERTGTRQGREGRQISGPSAGGGRAGSAAGRGQGARQGGEYTWQPTRLIVRGYRTFGPYEWAKSWVSSYAYDRLGDSRFREYYDKLTAAKLNYIFGPVNPKLVDIHYPIWITDLEEARQTTDPNGNPIRKVLTRYYYIEVISKKPEGAAGWASSITSDNLDDPVAKDFAGWVPPEDLRQMVFGNNAEVKGPEQVGLLPMWRFTSEGKETITNPDGSVKDEWPVYFSWYFIFGGVDTGPDNWPISNPANWDSFDVPPAPMIMDGSEEDTDEGMNIDCYSDYPNEGVRREHFAYLGIVRSGTRSAVWGQKFRLSNPTKSIFTVAQAKIFNNSSWDLWTQDWQVQLTRVVDWDDWTTRLGLGLADVPLTEGMVREEDVTTCHEFMRAWPPPMADMSIHH